MVRRSGKNRAWFIAGISISLILAGLIWGYSLVSRTPDQYKEQISSTVQKDFLQAIKAAEDRSFSLAEKHSVGREPEWQDGTVRLLLDKEGNMLDWNQSAWTPGMRTLSDLRKLSSYQTYSEKNKLYYFFANQVDGYSLFSLVPLQVTYRIQNSNLPPYLFLGRYLNRPFVSELIPKLQVQLKESPDAINIFDDHGNFAFGFKVPHPERFFYFDRVIALSLLIFGVVIGIWLLHRILRQRKGQRFAAICTIALVLGLRILGILFSFPAAYVPIKLFSPTVLALDNITPSLGDLIWNVLTLLLVIHLLFRAFHRPIARIYRKVLSRTWISWALHGYILAFSVLLITFFFHQLDRITLNSKINFVFSNIFELDGFSVLAFMVIGMMLLGLQIVLFHLLRFSFHFVLRNKRQWWAVGAFSITCLLLPAWIIWGFSMPYIFVVIVSVLLTLAILARNRGRFLFRLDILNFLLGTTLFSLLTSVGIMTGENTRRKAEMELIAERLSDQHDLVTESLYDRVVKEVKESVLILQYDPGEIAEGLLEDFFKQNFKGYEVRIFVYDGEQHLLEKTYVEPYLPANQDLKLANSGLATQTEGLYLMPYFQDSYDKIYVGEFNLPPFRNMANLLVQVELWPSEIRPNQLYPNLLIDDVIRTRSSVGKAYDYAIYQGDRLFRKHSSESFPRLFSAPSYLANQGYVHARQPEYNLLFYKASESKTIVVRAKRQGFFDAANMFSFIFYFNILGFILVMIPRWAYLAIRGGRTFFQTSLRVKIQLLFLSLSVVPLFIVLFLLSPYIKQQIFQELSQSLQDETGRVAGLVRDAYLQVYKEGSDQMASAAALQAELVEIERSVFNDVNIYNRLGRLDFTTQPSIYDLGLNSEFMNPAVFAELSAGAAYDQVVEESIGKLSYFSGYYPLMTDAREVIGYVNIPFLKNQDQVNDQSQNLLTFLVDVYVFIFLGLGVVAVVISNSIIRPLNLLGARLEATNLGKMNDPIPYDSKDEVGQIIRSYNQMLTKLAESEKKLAQNQREMAWKEMARQVAHEIKNPLTPMKLSVQHLIRAWGAKAANLDTMFEKVTRTILVQIDSLVNIANSFSEFAKMPEPNRSVFELNEVIGEVAELYGHEDKVQLELHLAKEAFFVLSDRDQLSRVFNNLVKNGIQAIEHDHGRVEIRMEVRGKESFITVRDNGKGIPEDIRKKIFEPNFSTKSSGMGLGLAIVKRIIQSSGGSIDFESVEGEGTAFHIVLPAAERPE